VIYENLVGKTFGKYKVVKQTTSKNWKRRWICECSCGEIRTISTEHLTSGKRTGCNSCNNGNKSKPFEALYNFLVSQAKGRTTVELSYKAYLRFTNKKECHYCGAVIVWEPHYSNEHGHKLDRKDNSLGYSRNNCVVCCPRCNRAKSNHFTYEEWVEIGKVIKAWHT
jgi:5-methylcytosine-specific restriction endonuclease McrA